MLDQNTINTLSTEFYVPIATINKISSENLSVTPGDFDILEYKSHNIPPGDIVQIIQYVYGMNLYNASEMYQVVADGRKPVNIITDEIEVKKRQ